MSQQTESDVTCTIDPEDAQERRAWAQDALVPHVERTEQLDDGVALVFEDAALEAVAELVRNEAVCCSFADFRIDYRPPYDTVRLAVTGPDGAADLFREGFVEGFDGVPEPT
ncbi:hypothetical protein HALDL1_14095 [Halobacterium sp. DL1]|jgi:hypothetical protein|nr:hypothetical protein HALDL1_14095 [Halobacterium sp. DL1]